MSAGDDDRCVALLAPTWSVPATLADLECRHGRLDACVDCAGDDHQVDEQQLELELAVTP